MPKAIRGLYKAFNFTSEEQTTDDPTLTVEPSPVPEIETVVEVGVKTKKTRGRPRRSLKTPASTEEVSPTVDPPAATPDVTDMKKASSTPTRLISRIRPTDLPLGEYNYLLVQRIVKVLVYVKFSYSPRKN